MKITGAAEGNRPLLQGPPLVRARNCQHCSECQYNTVTNNAAAGSTCQCAAIVRQPSSTERRGRTVAAGPLSAAPLRGGLSRSLVQRRLLSRPRTCLLLVVQRLVQTPLYDLACDDTVLAIRISVRSLLPPTAAAPISPLTRAHSPPSPPVTTPALSRPRSRSSTRPLTHPSQNVPSPAHAAHDELSSPPQSQSHHVEKQLNAQSARHAPPGMSVMRPCMYPDECRAPRLLPLLLSKGPAKPRPRPLLISASPQPRPSPNNPTHSIRRSTGSSTCSNPHTRSSRSTASCRPRPFPAGSAAGPEGSPRPWRAGVGTASRLAGTASRLEDSPSGAVGWSVNGTGSR